MPMPLSSTVIRVFLFSFLAVIFRISFLFGDLYFIAFEIKFETVPKNKHSQHKDIGKLYTQKSFDVKVLDVKDDVYLVQLQGGSKAVLEVTKAQLKSKKK